MLDFDIWNIILTAVNLLVLYLFMRHFLIKPVRRILDERKAIIEGSLDEAAQKAAEAARLKEQYEASLADAKEESAGIIKEARTKAEEEYKRIVSLADAEAAEKLAQAKKTIALEREKAMEDLKAGVAGLAMTAAARLLSEQAGPERDKIAYNQFLAESGDRND